MNSSFVAERSGFDGEAIAARQAEIVGEPQRIAPPPIEAIGPDILETINTIRSAIGLGPATDLTGYGLTMAKHPEVFHRQLEMGTTLFKGRLPAREREIAILRIGWLLRAPYEWGEHVVIAQRYGVARERIAWVVEGPTAEGWNEHEAAILRGVDEILSNQFISDATWATLAATWDEQQLIEFPMMVGQYVCTAIVQNSLRIRLETGNLGLTYPGAPAP